MAADSPSFPDVVITEAAIGADVIGGYAEWHGEVTAVAIFEQYLDDIQALQVATALWNGDLCPLIPSGVHRLAAVQECRLCLICLHASLWQLLRKECVSCRRACCVLN